MYCKCNATEFCANACQCSTITHNNRCSFMLSTYSPHVPSLYSALPPPVAASRVMALTTLEDVLAVKQTLALWSSSCACSCTVARVASFSSRTCSTITSYGSTSSYRPASDIFRYILTETARFQMIIVSKTGMSGKKTKKYLVQNSRTTEVGNPAYGCLHSSVGQSARLVSVRSRVRTSVEAIFFCPPCFPSG